MSVLLVTGSLAASVSACKFWPGGTDDKPATTGAVSMSYTLPSGGAASCSNITGASFELNPVELTGADGATEATSYPMNFQLNGADCLATAAGSRMTVGTWRVSALDACTSTEVVAGKMTVVSLDRGSWSC